MKVKDIRVGMVVKTPTGVGEVTHVVNQKRASGPGRPTVYFKVNGMDFRASDLSPTDVIDVTEVE